MPGLDHETDELECWDEDTEQDIVDQDIEAWLSEQWMENAMLHGVE